MELLHNILKVKSHFVCTAETISIMGKVTSVTLILALNLTRRERKVLQLRLLIFSQLQAFDIETRLYLDMSTVWANWRWNFEGHFSPFPFDML